MAEKMEIKTKPFLVQDLLTTLNRNEKKAKQSMPIPKVNSKPKAKSEDHFKIHYHKSYKI